MIGLRRRIGGGSQRRQVLRCLSTAGSFCGVMTMAELVSYPYVTGVKQRAASVGAGRTRSLHCHAGFSLFRPSTLLTSVGRLIPLKAMPPFAVMLAKDSIDAATRAVTG